jgi:hypothetical protein
VSAGVPEAGKNTREIVFAEETDKQTDKQIQRGEMTVALPGQLNLDETLSWGSRSVDFFEKIEQIGEGTYGYGYVLLMAFLVSFLLLRRLMFPAHDFLIYSSCVLPDLSSGVLLVFPLGTLFCGSSLLEVWKSAFLTKDRSTKI